MVSFEQLVDLSPNMRLALFQSDGKVIQYRDTWWITLQALRARGLVDSPAEHKGDHPLTDLGVAYKRAITHYYSSRDRGFFTILERKQ
jgi:hypothetical protein